MDISLIAFNDGTTLDGNKILRTEWIENGIILKDVTHTIFFFPFSSIKYIGLHEWLFE